MFVLEVHFPNHRILSSLLFHYVSPLTINIENLNQIYLVAC